MQASNFMRVEEVAEELDISKSHAYKIVHQLNAELQKKGYLHTLTMTELFQTVYMSRPPVAEGLLYTGAYILAGAPKIGKSFLVAQIACHVSTGQDLWGYKVHGGTVLYLALEDDFQRIQSRMFMMYGVNDTPNLQDQILYLKKDPRTQCWNLERMENELHKEPPDPVLETIAQPVKESWSGSPTELVSFLQIDMLPNTLTKHLNVNSGRLLLEYHIQYTNSHIHAGRRIKLTPVSEKA